MPRARRQDLYWLQAHALSDAIGVCTGSIPLARDYDAEWTMLLCPLCLDWYRLSAMDEDHAPQKAGQSSMGPAQVVILTCRGDNGNAGRTYEATAHALGGVLTAVADPFCPVHQRQRTTATGLHVITDRAPFELTDVRAAYLVAFATLGYRWALTARLGNLRVRIREGDLRYAATDYEILCFHDVPGLEPFHVFEINDPLKSILVTGAHASVLLPCHASPADLRGAITKDMSHDRQAQVTTRTMTLTAEIGRHWAWPRQFVGPGGTPEMSWDDIESGSMFHYDRCLERSHHLGHAVPRGELRSLQRVHAAMTSYGGSQR